MRAMIVLATSSVATTAAASAVGSPTLIGTIGHSNLREVSGIVDSRSLANVFWVHNDRGDSARFFAISRQGSLLGTFPLAGAPDGDWEDIALGPRPGGGHYLYLGDVGDNNLERPYVAVYRAPEPTSTASATIPAANYATAFLQYPGGPRNCEAIFVDPSTDDLYLITKGSTTEIFRAPGSAFNGGLTTLTPMGVLGAPLNTVTAADLSPNGRQILVRNRTAGYLFERAAGQSIADVLLGPGVPFTLGAEVQGEAIGWARDGLGFYTTSEMDGGSTAPIYSYVYAPPRQGDFDLNGAVDEVDFDLWLEFYGPTSDVDADGDLDSDGADFLIWQRNLGTSSPVVATPEPPTAGPVAGGAVLLGGGRSRMRRRPLRTRQ